MNKIDEEIQKVLNEDESKNEAYKYPEYPGLSGIGKVEYSTRGGLQTFENVMTKWDDEGHPIECEIVYNGNDVIARIKYDERYNDSDLETAVEYIVVLDEFHWYMFIELMMSNEMNW